MVQRILVIDDEENMRWVLERAIRNEGYEVESAGTGQEGLDLLKQKNASLLVLDLKLPDLDGLEVFKQARLINPKLPVIMITAHGSIETAIEAMRLGATDYVTKPFDLNKLKVTINNSLLIGQLDSEVNYLRTELSKKYDRLVGESRSVQELRNLINRIANTNSTVLITGESGTGKEVTAMTIHRSSNRQGKPFVVVNCATLPEQLLESELFGHEKGAFTGANNRKLGRFELADQGTIFLDEISEMPYNMQAKLLRVLQERAFERVGGTETIEVDVRVIAATNAKLSKAIKQGLFREDLYYRLNVINIQLPPLRERKEDVPLLVSHMLQKFDKGQIKHTIAPKTMELLCSYNWPGNIRELQNVLERALIICEDTEILPQHLPQEIQMVEPVQNGGEIDLPEDGVSLENVEKQLILKALQKTGGNQTRTAKLLGISRSALIYRMQKHHIIKVEEKVKYDLED